MLQVAGQLVALFSSLADRQVAGQLVILLSSPSDRQVAGQLVILFSSLSDRQVAGQLVTRLEGGESQVPALVAAPVLAVVVASDGGAALSAIANMDPLYLSDNPGKSYLTLPLPDSTDMSAGCWSACWWFERIAEKQTVKRAGDGGTTGPG